MSRFVDMIRALTLALGAPGLVLIAALDSSFLSLPEIADLLVVWMVTHHKARFLLYAASATLGSFAGSLTLYYIGRKGGEALVRRRFATATVERTTAAFRRYGILAVLIPSILPPPAPFKIFVLLAGAMGVSAGQFSLAILIGRGARYLVLAVLAVRYGDAALGYMRENGLVVSLVVAGILAAGFAAYLLWGRTRGRKRA